MHQEYFQFVTGNAIYAQFLGRMNAITV